jgi:hypothetical protein
MNFIKDEKVLMNEDPFIITAVNEWPDKENTYDLISEDKMKGRYNIPGSKLTTILNKNK